MTVATGETQREAAALADSLTSQSNNSSQPEQVPVHVVQSLRDELRAEKEKNETFRNHMQMMQWQSNQAPQQQQQYNPFGNADPEDSVKIKDVQRIMSDMEQRQNSQLAEIKLASRTPDYKDVIQKYLPKAAQEDPELLDEIKRSANPYKTAYMAAKASQAYQEDIRSSFSQSQSKPAPERPKVDPEAERIVQNSKASGNLASVGNNARAQGGNPDYRNMTDEDFRKLKAQNLFGSKKR